MSIWSFGVSLVLLLLPVHAQENFRWAILSDETGTPIPCRVHLKDAANKPVQAPRLPFWRDHFVCGGEVALKLPAGAYTYAVERGPEYSAATGSFEVANDRPIALTNRLKRIANLPREGWWPGELHVHRPVADIELLMRAEDLHIAPVITWWNKENPWTNELPSKALVQFDGDRFYHLMGGEDERAGGALLYFNLSRPLKISDAKYEHPSPMRFLAEARRDPDVWVDIEKPFWYDAPVWFASGMADSVGIANNHMHRVGMYPGEAWGRARDTNRLAAPHGNGLWSQEIYYHLLNTGLRLPPSAGSASGVLPNPVGYNRAYVHVDGGLTYEKWFQNLRAGRVFVSNGPLLRVRANGQLPGQVFRFANGEALAIKLEAIIDSHDPLEAIEIVQNGKVIRTIAPAEVKTAGPMGELAFTESGWFLVRARANVPETFRFASTGPFYVERIDAPARVSRASAQFFVDWIRERMARIKVEDPAELEQVLGYQREAERFWRGKLAAANAE